jgi:hypothetical protein
MVIPPWFRLQDLSIGISSTPYYVFTLLCYSILQFGTQVYFTPVFSLRLYKLYGHESAASAFFVTERRVPRRTKGGVSMGL